MASLITLNHVSLAFGHHDLLRHVQLTIHDQERIGLIGRNGAGKSSLFKILAGQLTPDDGEIARQNGLSVMMIEQDPVLDPQATVYEMLTADMHASEDWSRGARAKALLEQIHLQPEQVIQTLSGGAKKRLALAHAFLLAPQLLLLDEPTNHLDLNGILWLETQLKNFSGTVMTVTHDRRFLDAIATRIVELDRGQLHSFPGHFSQWQERKAAWLEAEAVANAKFDKFLSQEEVWIRKGIEARRTRNEGRVRRLEQLRIARAERRDRVGNVHFQLEAGERSGKLVAELKHVSHQFGDRVILQDYSTTIMRGDRIGIIGPNGAGKTTLLKIILGVLTPQQGSVRLGTNLQIAYVDQMREQLDEQLTVAQVINPGSEWVEIGQQKKHVMSYLGDFLFSPARANSPVSSLSGGEKARLLLARLFARPANILVLDEPTNDLDIETLELLEELLQNYTGTVLLISHDRAFTENVVTQSIVYQGHGKWQDEVGVQWSTATIQQAPNTERSASSDKKPTTTTKNTPKPRKLGQYEQKELAALPDKIEALERQQQALTQQLSDPHLYETEQKAQLEAVYQQIEKVEQEIDQLMNRWEKLSQYETS